MARRSRVSWAYSVWNAWPATKTICRSTARLAESNFSLHVDTEQGIECDRSHLVGAGDDDRLTGDVLVVEVDAGPAEVRQA